MIRSMTVALAASLFAASPAQACNAETPTRLVRTADLNLASDAGRATLDRRIRSAARSVCRGAGSYGIFARRMEVQCVAKSIERTRPQVTLLIAAARSGIAVTEAVPIG